MSCAGCGDGGAVDGGVYFDVWTVTMVSIQSDAALSVVVSASDCTSVRVPRFAVGVRVSLFSHKAVVGLCVWYILTVCILTVD